MLHMDFYEFIICCGYKGHMIKEYFVNYYQNNSQLEISLKNQLCAGIKGETVSHGRLQW